MDSLPSPNLRVAFATLAAVAAAAAAVSFLVVVPAQTTLSTADVSITFSPVHYLDFGLSSGVSGDCVYAEMQGTSGASAVAPNASDVRYTPCLDKTGMSVVTVNDVAETGYGTGSGDTAPTVTVRYADLNGDSAFQAGEMLFLGTETGTALSGSTSTTAWSIRLQAGGGQPAGSFVYPEHSDRQAANGHMVTATASLAWTDDTGTGRFFHAGDSLYVLPTQAAGLAKGSTLPSNAVKIYPPAAATTTSSTTTNSSSSTSSTTSSSSPTSTSSSTSPTTSSTTSPTTSEPPSKQRKPLPAVAPLASLVALGLALVLAQRRR